MPYFRNHPAAEFLRSFPVPEGETVPIQRVIAQRAIFAELSATALLEPSLDILLAKACSAGARACGAPMAKVLEHRPGSGDFLIRAGLNLQPGVIGHVRVAADSSNPAGQAFETGRPVAVGDIRDHPEYHLPPVLPAHGVVSSANVPIIGLSGSYGVLEVDATEEREFDPLDLSFLASVAEIVADAVERVRRHSELQAVSDARDLLLREHHHRVRNSYQLIVGQLELEIGRAGDENARQKLEQVQRRIFALASLYDHLIENRTPGPLDFSRYVADLCQRMQEFYALEAHGIELLSELPDLGLRFGPEVCSALGTVVNELVANAIEHAFAEAGGRIEVRLVNENGASALIVADNGRGLSGGESTGTNVARRLVYAAGGELIHEQTERGTRWRIRLPDR